MARPDKDDSLKKRPRTLSMTDNEWDQLRIKALNKNQEYSQFVIDKCGIKDIPVSPEDKLRLIPKKKES